jgi:hypothetical protein
VEAGGGEGHPVVRSDRAGHAGDPEGALDERAHADAVRGEQAVAGEPVAGVLIGHGQGIAGDPVAGPELALDVRRPEVVGLGGRGRDHPGVWRRTPPPALLDQAFAREPVAGRTTAGQSIGG